jgi:hypothetical protein
VNEQEADMPKRSTNFNSRRFRPTAADLANLMDWAGISPDEQRRIAEQVVTPAPMLYRFAYRARLIDPWQHTASMAVADVPRTRAYLEMRYAHVVRQTQQADGAWVNE